MTPVSVPKDPYLLAMQNLRAAREDLLSAFARIKELEVKLTATEAYAERLMDAGECMEITLKRGGYRSKGQDMWREAKETKP
jgi:hypothetical protein